MYSTYLGTHSDTHFLFGDYVTFCISLTLWSCNKGKACHCFWYMQCLYLFHVNRILSVNFCLLWENGITTLQNMIGFIFWSKIIPVVEKKIIPVVSIFICCVHFFSLIGSSFSFFWQESSLFSIKFREREGERKREGERGKRKREREREREREGEGGKTVKG